MSLDTNFSVTDFSLFYPPFEVPSIWDHPLGEKVKNLIRLTLPIWACLPSGNMIKLLLGINIKILAALKENPDLIIVEKKLAAIFNNKVPIVIESRYSRQNYIFSKFDQDLLKQVLKLNSLALVSLKAFLL